MDKDLEKLKTKRATPSTSPDKREMMLFREAIKISFIALIVSLLWLVVLIYFDKTQNTLNNYNEKTIINLNKKIDSLSTVEKIIPIKKEVDYNNLNVVIKTSKDIRKYFVSYKKYYSKDKYNLIIREINFTEYMSLTPNDTLTNTNFNNGK